MERADKQEIIIQGLNGKLF